MNACGAVQVWEVGARVRKEGDDMIRRRRALRRLDRELDKGNFKSALSFVKQLQRKPGGLTRFGAAKLVPKRISTMDELELNEMDKMALHSSVNSILDSVKSCRQFALEEEEEEVGLAQESSTYGYHCHTLSNDRVMHLQHEAGHFVVGYLLGVLPKRYRVPSMEDLIKDNFAGGKVEFLGFEFLREVYAATSSNKSFIDRKHSNETLNRFLCVILGGLAAEHLTFGYSELLHSDVEKLDRVLKWLGFCLDEANLRVRWAAMNTVLILRKHHEVTSRVAEAMASGRSIGFCIDAIESASINREQIFDSLKHGGNVIDKESTY